MFNIMNRIVKLLFPIAGIMLVQSCSGLSGEAKKIAGSYVIPEVSQQMPVMELNRDATCVVRAIKPGVLTYAVMGTWNVENDSLVMLLDPTTLMVEEGDASLVGHIPARSARKVAGYTDLSLELKSGDVVYYYKKVQL